MSETGGGAEDRQSHSPEAEPAPERIPAMQQILDNPFLLLFLGVTIPTVIYLIWGIMEIAGIPVEG
ncbi:MAG: hypothetical protein H3C51_01565 [Rubellimicrobium sp.]|nr:hypothetical protein [Rubellimicrobium sp.]